MSLLSNETNFVTLRKLFIESTQKIFPDPTQSFPNQFETSKSHPNFGLSYIFPGELDKINSFRRDTSESEPPFLNDTISFISEISPIYQLIFSKPEANVSWDYAEDCNVYGLTYNILSLCIKRTVQCLIACIALRLHN